MQMLSNSGYGEQFRAEILKSGLAGYNKILEADMAGTRPIYRSKGWNISSRRMDKQRKGKNWLGPFWKSYIFVPPTPGSELKKMMQAREEKMRAGGRESYPIKIIETAGKTLEQTLVNTDPFNGNQCNDKKCVVSTNPNNNNNKINCRRNCICYEITCLLCLKDGKEGNFATSYFGENGKNMHCRAREHISKFNSKSRKLQQESAFLKHLENSHGGRSKTKAFSEYFDITILKAYRKPFTKSVEEGTFIASHKGDLLNSKSEWHQAKIIRTTTTVIQGGADVVRSGVQQVRSQEAGGGVQGGLQLVGGGQGVGGRQGPGGGQGAGVGLGAGDGQGAGEGHLLQEPRRRSPRGQ